MFIDALRSARRPLIMEVKCRDAHGTELLDGRAVGEVVRRYARAGAPCLSVVTGRWFGGTPDLLTEVARHTFSWQWVKGHAGDPGNERADQLANRGVPAR